MIYKIGDQVEFLRYSPETENKTFGTIITVYPSFVWIFSEHGYYLRKIDEIKLLVTHKDNIESML